MKLLINKGVALAGDLKGDDPLYKYCVFVCLAHGAVLIGIYLMGVVSDQVLSLKGKKLETIQSSVRVDVVAMPKFTQRELQQMKVWDQQSSKEEGGGAKAAGEEVLKEKSGPSFLDQIKKLSKKKVKVKRPSQGKSNRNSESNAEERKKLGKLILAGNKLSAGTALTGDINTGELSELRRYMESLPQFVRPHWTLPSYLKEQDLQCRIRIFIGRGGKLLQSRIVESSGDAQYDKYALQAIRRTQFPTPAEAILKELVRGVVVLGFPL